MSSVTLYLIWNQDVYQDSESYEDEGRYSSRGSTNRTNYAGCLMTCKPGRTPYMVEELRVVGVDNVKEIDNVYIPYVIYGEGDTFGSDSGYLDWLGGYTSEAYAKAKIAEVEGTSQYTSYFSSGREFGVIVRTPVNQYQSSLEHVS